MQGERSWVNFVKSLCEIGRLFAVALYHCMILSISGLLKEDLRNGHSLSIIGMLGHAKYSFIVFVFGVIESMICFRSV